MRWDGRKFHPCAEREDIIPQQPEQLRLRLSIQFNPKYIGGAGIKWIASRCGQNGESYQMCILVCNHTRWSITTSIWAGEHNIETNDVIIYAGRSFGECSIHVMGLLSWYMIDSQRPSTHS